MSWLQDDTFTRDSLPKCGGCGKPINDKPHNRMSCPVCNETAWIHNHATLAPDLITPRIACVVSFQNKHAASCGVPIMSGPPAIAGERHVLKEN